MASLANGCGPDESEDPSALVTAGEALFESEGCTTCHGAQGQGITAPRLSEGSVLDTFPACEDQLEWVSLGSARWVRQVGTTYGANSKPVRGGMPGFGERLSPEQIREVVAYTRVAFGGADPAEVADHCRL